MYDFTEVKAGTLPHKVRLFFHIECYKLWSIAVFERRYKRWLEDKGAEHRVGLGRKKSYKLEGQAKEVNKLNALIYYHRKHNHPEKVIGLMVKLQELQKGLVQIPAEKVVPELKIEPAIIQIPVSTTTVTVRGKVYPIPDKFKNFDPLLAASYMEWEIYEEERKKALEEKSVDNSHS